MLPPDFGHAMESGLESVNNGTLTVVSAAKMQEARRSVTNPSRLVLVRRVRTIHHRAPSRDHRPSARNHRPPPLGAAIADAPRLC